MSANGEKLDRLTANNKSDGNPSWSPDGTKIVFDSLSFVNLAVPPQEEIYVINADGTNPVNLTNHEADDSEPSWSPDGTQIAFTSNRDGNNEIYAVNANGANPINLTNHKANDSQPSWSTESLAVSPKGKLTTQWGKIKREH